MTGTVWAIYPREDEHVTQLKTLKGSQVNLVDDSVVFGNYNQVDNIPEAGWFSSEIPRDAIILFHNDFLACRVEFQSST